VITGRTICKTLDGQASPTSTPACWCITIRCTECTHPLYRNCKHTCLLVRVTLAAQSHTWSHTEPHTYTLTHTESQTYTYTYTEIARTHCQCHHTWSLFLMLSLALPPSRVDVLPAPAHRRTRVHTRTYTQ